ncbi:3-phosphoshikimate 1-carboxyvinyltransferase [Desulfovibrio litoralis]|uniref:3-phosphoshikimate 1-carboxyvinyltransferase n=1 Tax=Desulfovibrio litoralis DSM 11393 TaxID=1121455 RepID=A0A1M7RRK2_9BACT|nr:3-phosphoshikimate 1-carboxyvinyltransferase [Desulfovibrio litoralis]SHN48811.1 3-phosphoshikimate 1-carboxyvinyltransferase [Desulfovibrio litoralis DSM 11393]
MSTPNTITIEAPASKSVSHRTVLAAALASGESIVHNVLESRDLSQTMAILQAVGATISKQKPGTYLVKGLNACPKGSSTKENPVSCDVHESGTTCRLLTAILGAGQGWFRVHGAPRMHERPLAELIKVLRIQGAEVICEQNEGYPPIIINASGFKEHYCEISLDESSQYLSGLLLAAPFALRNSREYKKHDSAQEITINIIGNKVVSFPYVALTLEILELHKIPFNIELKDANGDWNSVNWREIQDFKPHNLRIKIKEADYKAGEYIVEGDWSNASYFFAAGILGNKPLEIKGLKANSLQGDKAIVSILRQMGAKIEEKADGELTIFTVYPSKLKGISVDMSACPDLVPTVAVVAAFAEGTTHIYNVAHLKIKECDRIAVPAQSLRLAEVKAEEKEDGLIIYGGITKTARTIALSTHQDHRIAMSLSLLEFAKIKPDFDDPSCVNKSFPNFWDKWKIVQDNLIEK